jgi:monoamine oxidase
VSAAKRQERSVKKVAIIGAGLAGLSAAYHLRLRRISSVTVFERDRRVGGRVWTLPTPRAEHGAEYLLKSELAPDKKTDKDISDAYKLNDERQTTLRRLFRELGIQLKETRGEWARYYFEGQYLSDSPEKAAKNLGLSLRKIIDADPAETDSFETFLSRRLRCPPRTYNFIQMLLAGETCAPFSHISAKYGAECLETVCDGSEKWYRVAGGSSCLAEALKKASHARFAFQADCIRVRKSGDGPKISWKREGERSTKTDVFQAVIITAPNGDDLLGRRPKPCFHGYISVLLTFHRRPRVKATPRIDLRRGLYMDNPLNYMQAQKVQGSWVVRVLIPQADDLMDCSDGAILHLCFYYLRQILDNPDDCVQRQVKRWERGLPCRGTGSHFEPIGQRIYLAGDRFSSWPSMAGAIVSGARAAEAVAKSLARRSRRPT